MWKNAGYDPMSNIRQDTSGRIRQPSPAAAALPLQRCRQQHRQQPPEQPKGTLAKLPQTDTSKGGRAFPCPLAQGQSAVAWQGLRRPRQHHAGGRGRQPPSEPPKAAMLGDGTAKRAEQGAQRAPCLRHWRPAAWVGLPRGRCVGDGDPRQLFAKGAFSEKLPSVTHQPSRTCTSANYLLKTPL